VFFGSQDAISVSRPDVPGISFLSNRSFCVALSVVFVVAGIGVLGLRRSAFGRRIIALTDSPAASLTLGVDVAGSKLMLFAVAAGLAGLGGALYGGSQGIVGPNDFAFLTSLTVLLMAVVWGIRTIGGMLIGGLLIALGPELQMHFTHPADLLQLLVGLAAIGISQNPEGTFGGNTPLQKWRDRRTKNLQLVGGGPTAVRESVSSATH
jgi:branched-chain amino acid transport system permease protein